MRSPFNDVELVAELLLGPRAPPETPEHRDEADLHEADDAEEHPHAVVRAFHHRIAGRAVADRTREQRLGEYEHDEHEYEVAQLRGRAVARRQKRTRIAAQPRDRVTAQPRH